jgi:hypothetical protein
VPNKKKTFKSFYKEYAYKYDIRDNRYVTQKQYLDTLQTFFKLLSKNILEEAYEYKIPHRLGYLKIIKFKGHKKKSIDWKKTNEFKEKHGVNKMIYHTNYHSQQYAARWHWSKREAMLHGKSLYRFVPTRNNKRTLARLIKEDNIIKKYYESIKYGK